MITTNSDLHLSTRFTHHDPERWYTRHDEMLLAKYLRRFYIAAFYGYYVACEILAKILVNICVSLLECNYSQIFFVAKFS